MHKSFFITLVLATILSFPGQVSAASLQKGDVLSLEKCLEIAVKNHPSVNAATGVIRQYESQIGQARAGYYPQIEFQSSYSRIQPSDASLLGDPYNYYSNSLGLNQMLFDFGKTGTSVEIAKLNTESARADLQDVKATVIYRVKETYYAFLKSRMSEKVAAETVHQFQQHYDVAKTFFETGKSSKIDVTSAEVNLSNARIQWISAQNALRIARATLNQAMGVATAAEYDIVEEFHLDQAEMPFESALAQAYQNRPDLRSVTRKIYALEKTVDLNKKGYLPVLSGNAAYAYAGDTLSTDNKSWNAGVSLSFPLFTGLSTKYAVDEANAAVEVARAEEESLKQTVYLEVQAAWLNRRAAFEQIEAGRLIVKQAEETLELAKGRYATGVGSSIEITDAMIKLNNAKMTYITALSDFSVAQAGLEKAVGENK